MMNQYVRCSGCGVVSKFNPDKVSCKLCAINVSTTDIFKPDLKEYNFDQSKLSILNYLNLHSRGYDFKNDLLAVCSLPVYFMGKLANRQILKLVLTSSDLSFQITDLAKELAGKDGELNSAHMLLKSLGFSLVYERKVISYRPYRFQKVFVNVKEKLAALLSIEKESGVISFMIEAPRLDGTICHASNDPNDFYLESNSSFCLPSASPDELVKLVRNNVKLTERRKVEFSLKKYSTATAAQFRNDVDAAIKDSSLVIENPSTGTVDIVEESTNNINVTSPSAPVATVAPPISKKVAPGIKCELHKDVNAETSCVICNKPLCSLCIREVKGIIYCDLHYSNTEDKDSNAKTAAVATESSELEVGRVGRSLNLENAGTIGPFGLFAVETVTFMLLMNLLLPIDLLPTFRFIPFETVTGISIGKATIYIYGLLLYNLLTVTLLAGTPLMHILRFKVISQDGSNASYINLIIRELYFIASAILLLPFIGYLFALFNYEKRSAGDIIAGTKVVTTDSKIKDYIGAGMIVLLLISALFFSKEFFKLGNIQDRSLNFSLSHNLPDKIIYKSQWTDYFPDATVDSDKFVISLKKNRLIAHNLTTGQNLWENNVKNSQELLISNDSQNLYVLLTGEETVLIIFNPQTGELLKSVRIDATSVKLIRLADSIIAYSPSKLISFSLGGEEVWNYSLDSDETIATVLTSKSNIMVSTGQNNYLLNGSNGKLLSTVDGRWNLNYLASKASILLSDSNSVALFSLLSNSLNWEIEGEPISKDDYKVEANSKDRIYLKRKVVSIADGTTLFPYPDGCDFKAATSKVVLFSCLNQNMVTLSAKDFSILDTFAVSGIVAIEFFNTQSNKMQFIVTNRGGDEQYIATILTLNRNGTVEDFNRVGLFKTIPTIRLIAPKNETIFIKSADSVGVYELPKKEDNIF